MTDEGGSLRVLLADEQPLFREAVRVVLEAEPDLQVVAEAGDGLQAVTKAERTLPDVALLDASLPNCDGIRAAAMIRERAPDCRVLILSGAEDVRQLEEGLEAGATGYLSKGRRLSDLIEATRAVHRGETLVPSTMLGELLARLLARRRERDEVLRRLPRLTPREREVLALLAEGADNDGIAQALVISPQTARTHIQNILGKLDLHSRLEAAAFVRRCGLLEDLLADSDVRSHPRRRPSRRRVVIGPPEASDPADLGDGLRDETEMVAST